LSVLALTATVTFQRAVLVSTVAVLRLVKDKVKNSIGVGAESASVDL
jgi:hypothetical protein